MLRPLAVAATLLALAGCSNDDPGAAGGGGAASTATGAGPTCPEGTTSRTIVIAASEPGASCIDLDADLALDVCEDPSSNAQGFICFEEVSSGRRIWLASSASTPRDGEAWTSCDAGGPPPPCVPGGCPEVASAPVGEVTSTCSEEDTRGRFRCGDPASPWDATCCPRPGCGDDGACPPGMVCAAAGHQTSMACARATDGSCDCGGTPDARVSDVCIPE